MRLRLKTSLASSMFVVLVFVVFSGTLAYGCPTGCACFVTDQVICNLAGLQTISPDIPTSTRYLMLNENRIRYIPSDAFKGFYQLKSIRFDDNNITEIAKYAFRGLSNVEEIIIQKNPLDHLPSYSFSGLDNINRIYLSYNKIASIESNVFHGSRNVREVSLIGNPIVVLQSNAFSGFTNAQFFYFPKNISRIEPDTFNGLKNVSMLRLESMNTRALEKFAFRGLDTVAGLEIRNSKIRTLEAGAFDGLSNVNYFGLEDNIFDYVKKGAFYGMKSVTILIVNKNTFGDVEDGGFVGLEKLNSKRFNFSDNHLPCDCTLHQIIASLRNSKTDVRWTNFCHFPEDVSGQRLSKIQLDQLEECPTMAPLTNNVVDKSQNTVDLDVSEDSSLNRRSSQGRLDHCALVIILASVLAVMM